MTATADALAIARLAALRVKLRRDHPRPDPHALYRSDPTGYVTQVRGVTWWEKQQEAASALAEHTRVMVWASHAEGKTHMAGGIVNWWYATAIASNCLTTAVSVQPATNAVTTWSCV